MMRSVVYGGEGISGPYWGTGGRAKNITGRNDLHGKTGTTNNVHDAWFSGFNAYTAATAWMGFDTDRDLGYSRPQGPEGGAYSALPIWAEYVKLTQHELADKPLPVPQGINKCTNANITDWCVKNGTSISDGNQDPYSPAHTGQYQQDKEDHQTETDTSTVTDDNIF